MKRISQKSNHADYTSKNNRNRSADAFNDPPFHIISASTAFCLAVKDRRSLQDDMTFSYSAISKDLSQIIGPNSLRPYHTIT